MNNSNVFIVTVDYRDAGGATTKSLSQISTPFMNFSSADETNRANILNEIDQALCFGIFEKNFTTFDSVKNSRFS